MCSERASRNASSVTTGRLPRDGLLERGLTCWRRPTSVGARSSAYSVCRAFAVAGCRSATTPHAGDAVDDLVGEALRHEAGAEDTDADRPAFGGALLRAHCRR